VQAEKHLHRDSLVILGETMQGKEAGLPITQRIFARIDIYKNTIAARLLGRGWLPQKKKMHWSEDTCLSSFGQERSRFEQHLMHIDHTLRCNA
jgi:hypothetical protein